MPGLARSLTGGCAAAELAGTWLFGAFLLSPSPRRPSRLAWRRGQTARAGACHTRRRADGHVADSRGSLVNTIRKRMPQHFLEPAQMSQALFHRIGSGRGSLEWSPVCLESHRCGPRFLPGRRRGKNGSHGDSAVSAGAAERNLVPAVEERQGATAPLIELSRHEPVERRRPRATLRAAPMRLTPRRFAGNPPSQNHNK